MLFVSVRQMGAVCRNA